MYLSKLELHGFKSFADRTTVEFSPGVTSVVGPNGCGKSNIVDAVRWVIGEQRARVLRSEKMDNVIFNGTAKRRSLGMSEVMLTIQNNRGVLPTEYSEVTIGRRLFRSGDSEYLLNGVQCRLKDITDLFMDTGMGAGAYSVIELKMIEEILSENALDRRHLFEEAAGITKYKIRRGQTLRKLKSTQVDLDRVRDITEELDRRVQSLERQARKAARHKEYESRLRILELTLAAIEYEQLAGEAERLHEEITSLAQQAESFSAKLASEEATHESLRTEHIARERDVVEAQKTFSDHVESLRGAESDLRISTERLAAISRDLTRLGQEEEQAVVRRQTLLELERRAKEQIADVTPAAEKAETELTDARRVKEETQSSQQKHQVMLHNLRLEERNVTNSRVERQRHLDRLSSRLEVVESDLDETRVTLKTTDTSAEHLDKRLEAARTRMDEVSEALVAAEARRDEAAADARTSREDIEAARESVRVAERSWDLAKAEVSLLESMLSSYDDFSEPVQYLASTSEWTRADMKTVSDILACDDENRIAVDAALGSWASCIVVNNEADAAQAIAALRSNEKGRATFLVLDRIPGQTRTPIAAPSGATSFGSLVRIEDDRHGPLLELLLGGSFLVDDLLASTPVPAGIRLFNRAGEWIDAAGSMHAGSAATGSSPAASRMGRREQLENAMGRMQSAGQAMDEATETLTQAQKLLEGIPLEDAETKLGKWQQEAVQAERELSRVTYEREVLDRRRTEIEERIATLDEQKETTSRSMDESTVELRTLTHSVADLQNKRADAEEAFQNIEEASRKAFSLFNEANITAVQTRNRLDNLKRDLQRTKEDMERLDRQAAERSAEVASLQQQKLELEEHCEELQSSIRELHEMRGELDIKVSEARDHLMETKVQISDLEARLRELRRDRETAMKEESKRQIRSAEIQTRLADLVEGVQEDFEVDLKASRPEIEEGFDRKEARSEVADLRGKIRNLGPVNALALDSFEEEKERLEFLTEQLADLEKAEVTLQTTINEINTTASERFDKTFEAIRENFRRLFSELFGEEATADVVLADPSDPLESDVQILAKPRGKKPSVLAQLSGGEKTLTAIALLFSIYLVKPSPFCILDEVDAPLDDANVDRFMHLIRTFSESTQFVLVTHNKRTMEAADRMYGITMQEQGVSKLVSVRFDSDLQQVA